MKRFIFIIGAVLLGITSRAQSGTYTSRYWFDQNDAQATTITFGDNGWEAELDVGQLPDGFHVLHLHVLTTNNEIRFGMLGDSLYQMADTTLMKWSAPESYLFLKISDISTYHYWFDQDFENRFTNLLGDGQLLLDVAHLEDGVHTVHVMLEGSTMTTTQSFMFIKMPVEVPSTELQFVCWFDQDYANKQTGLVGSGLFELEVSDLPNGIHTVNVQINNGTNMAPQSYLFYKIPVGGLGVAKWQYWLNDDTNNKHTLLTNPVVDTLEIVSLLPVETWPIRSSCFYFHPNGNEPYLNAKNEITFRFWSTDGYTEDRRTYYVDEQVEQSIDASIIERNTTETFLAPRDNQIKWFNLDASEGDWLEFKTNKACTIQLFSPSGEEVYNASGPESLIENGVNIWENGTYYLAVHDVTGTGETISLTYNWVYRYAIYSYDVHCVGSGGCSTITFHGNGFNSLIDVYFVNSQNDTLTRCGISHESNTTIPVMFNFNGTNTGLYDAVFEFYNETLRINNALEVEEPREIVLESRTQSPDWGYMFPPVTYTCVVTNTGNMTAYNVPFYISIESPSFEDISHIDLEGIPLPSILDYFNVNWDSIQYIENVIDLRHMSDEIGDEHNFYRQIRPYGETGYPAVRSNYFFVDLAPNETKTIRLTLTPNRYGTGLMGAWITTPNQIISPYIPNATIGGDSVVSNGSNNYCCLSDRIQCTADLICDGLDVVDLFGLGSDISSCLCGVFSNGNDFINRILCEGENPMDALKSLNKRSIAGTAMSCINLFNPGKKISTVLNIGSKTLDAWTLGEMAGFIGQGNLGSQATECAEKWTNRKPDCPPGNTSGGLTFPRSGSDPNDIHGYISESGSHYMRQQVQNVFYEIEFENDTTLATAAAHTIIVCDTLDATKFDMNSLAARSVTIGDKRLDLNGEQSFTRTMDMRPELYVIAQIQQDFDPMTGIIEWTIQSLDPMTMELTDDPSQGVLPVNYNGDGVGFIDYSIDLKESFADGTQINNRAGITFDQEEVIMTPTWTNTVDAVKPTSHIEEVTPVADSLNFVFVSEDNRSGVWYYTLYYRNDSTEMLWQVKKPRITVNSLMLFFDDFQTTEYLVMAVDSAGNMEEKEMLAEYIHYYDGPVPITQCEDLLKGWNWFAPMVSTTINDIENSLNGYHENIMSEYDRTSSNIEPGEMLKIETNADCTLSLTGIPFITAVVEVTNGTNWLGYIGTEKAVEEVFNADFGPAEGDKIISQDGGFAIFNGVEWKGTLETLQPGHGYVYYSNTNEPKTLLMEQ